jgi:DNA-binding winged helix-turn-helix (wHTH) protein
VIYIFDNYTLDGNKRELRDREVVIQLQPQVFDLLEFLLRNRDRVVSKDEMLAAVWGGRIVSESTLASRINAARSAIGDNGQDQRLIRTFLRKGLVLLVWLAKYRLAALRVPPSRNVWPMGRPAGRQHFPDRR